MRSYVKPSLIYSHPFKSITSSMDLSSLFRRGFSRSSQRTQNPEQLKQSNQNEKEDELLGVTDQLIDYIKSFTLDTFKNFPLQDDEAVYRNDQTQTASSPNVRKDLSEWQERHAILMLSKVKELSQLRFSLCPRHLKEQQFWRIYFALVKSHVAEYELHAIQLSKLKQIAMENEKRSDTSAFEVEMADRTKAESVAPSIP